MKIEILPEDLDKAVEECSKPQACRTQHCLLAQVGMRVTGHKQVECSFTNVFSPNCGEIYLKLPSKVFSYVVAFDQIFDEKRKIIPKNVTELRALLPVDITPCSD